METEAMTQETDPLTGTNWQVEDIDGGGVIDRSPATVQFPEPGRVAGNSSCNRYMGGYEREGESLTFGALAGTMMACPEALMNQERRFYEAMEQVTGWRIDPQTDLLHLLNEAGETIIRASRMPAEDPAGN
jgi:heat shock protein HslJ